MPSVVLPELPVAAGENAAARRMEQSRRGTVLVGLVMAVVILGAAWFVGGRVGFDQIGQGGVNLSLLPKVGDPAPDVAVALTDGEVVHLSDFRGQPLWLNFWGSWCPPRRAEMPDMQAAYEELTPRGLVVLAVSLNEPTQAAADYAALNHVTFLIASDPQRQATGTAYPIYNFPTHILIDKDGIVRDVVLSELSEQEIVAHAQAILPSEEGV